MKKAIVTGAGGFIGSHFVRYLKRKGYIVQGIDRKRSAFSKTAADELKLIDLRDAKAARRAIRNADELYMFAANTGGIGYIETVHAPIMHDDVLINAHSLESAHKAGISKTFFASSACIYPLSKQTQSRNPGLKESGAYPADPEGGYGWEKLFSENMCLAYAQDFGMQVRIARFHNVYGPEGVFKGGREKSPAAICRKVAMAKSGDTIEVWGDGRQARSYCYIDDCCEGVFRLMQSDYAFPINIGSTEMTTINQLVDIVAKIAGKKIRKRYNLTKPQGVRGRNSDNALIKKVLKWEPSISIREGIRRTYEWINTQVDREVLSQRTERGRKAKKTGISIR